jgi:hypothetical protein
MNSHASTLPYRYDPGEHRLKHCGNEPYAHFRQEGSGFIWICPSTLSKKHAEDLLCCGVPDYDLGAEHPKRIYAVHEGVVYEARPTASGLTYHGFPWRGRPGHNRLPRPIQRQLRDRAEKAGCLKAFNHWLDQYES